MQGLIWAIFVLACVCLALTVRKSEAFSTQSPLDTRCQGSASIQQCLLDHPEFQTLVPKQAANSSGSPVDINVSPDKIQTLCNLDKTGHRTGAACVELLSKIAGLNAMKRILNEEALYQAMVSRLQSGNSFDSALLFVLHDNPGLAEPLFQQAFPTRGKPTANHAQPLPVTYELRVAAICDLGYKARGFSSAAACMSSKGTQQLLTTTAVRAVFEQILMDDTVYACLINNFMIDGDIDYCLYSFFQQHPDLYVQLEQASKQVLLQSQQTVGNQVGPPVTAAIPCNAYQAKSGEAFPLTRALALSKDKPDVSKCLNWSKAASSGIRVLGLFKNGDGIYELHWQSENATTPQVLQFQTMEEFQSWWQQMLKNTPALQACENPANASRNPSATLPLTSALVKSNTQDAHDAAMFAEGHLQQNSSAQGSASTVAAAAINSVHARTAKSPNSAKNLEIYQVQKSLKPALTRSNAYMAFQDWPQHSASSCMLNGVPIPCPTFTDGTDLDLESADMWKQKVDSMMSNGMLMDQQHPGMTTDNTLLGKTGESMMAV